MDSLPIDWSPLFVSFKTSVVATAIAFLFGVVAARLVLQLRGRTQAILDGVFTLPMVLPPTVLGFFLLVFFGRNSPIGRLLMEIGIRIIFSWEATVIAAAVVAFPLIYKTVRASFEQIDPTVLQAARTLGLPEYLIFFRIMIPMAWPGAAAGSILGFARALGEFGATLMIAGNIPGRTQTIPIAIFFSAEGGHMDLALMWVLIIVAISFSVIIAMNLLGRRKG
ncbi:MAG: molybdenum ABC transporter permease subunit [Fibrobacteres bacterium CG2_30_45_31]|nr:MAG: molybdenum ABC transporter permease subunit [Fibrobacteres bacterium CG2_30_45_31]